MIFNHKSNRLIVDPQPHTYHQALRYLVECQYPFVTLFLVEFLPPFVLQVGWGISYDRSEITSHLTPPPPLYFWIHIGMRWWSERETFGPPTKPPKKGGMFRVFSSQNKHYFAVRRITHHSLHSTSSFKWPSSILIVLCNNCRGLLALDVLSFQQV